MRLNSKPLRSNGKVSPVLHKRMNDEYQAWAKLNSPTTAQHVDKWFSILRANGVGF